METTKPPLLGGPEQCSTKGKPSLGIICGLWNGLVSITSLVSFAMPLAGSVLDAELYLSEPIAPSQYIHQTPSIDSGSVEQR